MGNKFIHYHEIEIPLSEVFEQLDKDLKACKDMDKVFGEIATDFLKEVKEMIEGWGNKFNELSAFHELKRAIEGVGENK